MVCMVASGCATSMGGGGEVIMAPSHGSALMGMVNGGIGVAHGAGATMFRGEGSLGITTSARAHAEIVTGFEHIWFGDKHGSQIGVYDGASVGDYQVFGSTRTSLPVRPAGTSTRCKPGEYTMSSKPIPASPPGSTSLPGLAISGLARATVATSSRAIDPRSLVRTRGR